MSATSDLRLRVMRDADLAAYKALRDSMLARYPDSFTSSAAVEVARSAESYSSRVGMRPGGHCLFTLCAWSGAAEPQMLGALTAEFDLRPKVRHIAHIIGMMVRESAQGRGIGRALLEQALRMLESEPVLSLVTLSVSTHNESAVRLYSSCGFTRYGRLENAMRMDDGRMLGKDLMSRPLPLK
ncbi:MAG TPA: N-acetyltransferase [Burkholderiaceae bacterium]